jgi:putative GTP pyrophosphokinase
MPMTRSQLADEYSIHAPRAERMRDAVVNQLGRLLRDRRATLAVQLESRVKSLQSLLEKVDRKALALDSLPELGDFVGIRAILLFVKDIDAVNDVIRKTFDVIHVEDAGGRLKEESFGYQSIHFTVRLPGSWLSVPTLADLGDIRAEIQVRTLAQHMWAAASHVLQYKQEASVPPPVRRAIHRASALLETVDLEFDRVLDARSSYVAATDAATSSESLNVDLLAAVLAEKLPEKNRSADEPYAELLHELNVLGVTQADKLRAILDKHRESVAAAERAQMEAYTGEDEGDAASKARRDAGVFFAHVGLAREALRLEFGEEEYDRLFMPLWAEKLVPGLDIRPVHPRAAR